MIVVEVFSLKAFRLKVWHRVHGLGHILVLLVLESLLLSHLELVPVAIPQHVFLFDVG